MNFLKQNWQLKLVSLAGAITMSIFVNRQVGTGRRTFVLPVSVPARLGQRVVEPSPGFQVYVDVSGPAEYVRTIDAKDLQLNFDPSNVPPGKRMQVPVSVDVAEKWEGRGLEIDWMPRTIPVKFTSDTVETFDVVPRPRNHLEGWRIKQISSEPPRVSVSGSQAAVGRVERVIAPFTVEASEMINVLGVGVRALDKDDNDITDQVVLEPAQVLVTGLQERVVLQKRVPVQPVFTVPSGRRVAVYVNPPVVTLVGPDRAAGAVYVIETEPVTLPPGQAQLNRVVRLVPPRDNLQINPSSVRLGLKLLPPGQAPGSR